MKAAEQYGGEDFACVLGQEMGGYATGEVFFTSQALGFRHSHLDTGGYSYDQKHDDQNVDKAVAFLVADERERVWLTSMVSCLFARKVYSADLLDECLQSVGYDRLAGRMAAWSAGIQAKRWQLRMATGYRPQQITIPKRFHDLTTWKGKTDPAYLDALLTAYARAITGLAQTTASEGEKR